MQKQLEKSATSSNDQKNKSSVDEEKNDYRNVPPPHKFSNTVYDEQKRQIAEDIDEAVQVAAQFIYQGKTKTEKRLPTTVSTNDDDQKEAATKKRRRSQDTLEDGELKTKKPKQETGANRAFFLGIDVGDVSSDDDDDDDTQANDLNKKKLA